MPIPLNTQLISGAVPLSVAGPAIALPIGSGAPINCLPFQLTFETNTAFLIDLSQGNPNPPLKQCAALYVDCINCEQGVTIVFPDTGYQKYVLNRSSSLFPILSANRLPKFYLVLDDNSVPNTIDKVNILALDSYVPGFEAQNFNQSLNFGLGEFFGLVNQYIQSVTFNYFDIGKPSLDTPFTLIDASQWYLTALNIQCSSISSVDNDYAYLILADSNIPKLSYKFACGTTQTVQTLANMSGLNIISFGTGNLTAYIKPGNNLTAYDFSFNLMGGKLEP